MLISEKSGGRLIFGLFFLAFFSSCKEQLDTDEMFGSSALIKELTAWMKNGGDLNRFLTSWDHKVKTKKEAAAIIAAIKQLQGGEREPSESSFSSPLRRLAGLFQKIETEQAFEKLRMEGLPLLRLEVARGLEMKPTSKDETLFLLKILALYRQNADVTLIARVAQSGYESDAYMWSVIFGAFADGHPYDTQLADALKEPLPTGFMAVAFLDFCNGLALQGKLQDHPFASSSGVAMLAAWLESANPEEFSRAHSATAAIPFLSEESRGPLLNLAQNHKNVAVRLEAAWASAKSGDATGLTRLTEYCYDPNHSTVAQRYLSDLGAADEIPAECQKPDFLAVAEMANWLAHPNEFGRPPTSIELYDTRTIYWPPTDDRRGVWLVKYRYAEPGGEVDVGVGMVGSVTFALFSEASAQLSPEDIYGLHCCWELQRNSDPRAPEERTAAAGRAILAERNTGF